MALPTNYKKLVVSKLTNKFREAVSVTTASLKTPGDEEVLIKNRYVGINATDVNITAGRYFTDGNVPFDIGFETVGEVVAVGSKVKDIKIGQQVACMVKKMGAYAEYTYVPRDDLFLIPAIKPEYVALLVSGLTAAIGLDKNGRITDGETVLITAAAGGTGHIAVQWAKAAGCHVIATCSSEKKSDILKDLGCDRVINYKTEDIDTVLSKEYPKGVDVIWETIGGKVFETCLKHLAIKGRLIIIGSITGYMKDKGLMPAVDLSNVPPMLLFKSAALQGFLVRAYEECFPSYFNYLMERVVKEELKILVDDGQKSTGQEFVGLDGIIKAVEYLHSGKSVGKVLVRIS